MRVTSQQIYDAILSGINKQLQTQSTTTEQISSGMRFTRPSQDGAGYKQSIDIRHVQNGITASLDGISTAKSRLGAGQSALSQMLPILQRAQAISVQQANGTLGATERQAAVAEVSTLQDQLLALANQKFEGEYLFSGTATGTAAYTGNASVGNATYTADTTTAKNSGITNIVQTANPNAVNDTYTITVDPTTSAITSVKNSAGTELLPSAPTGVSLTANSTATLNLKNGVTLVADTGTLDTTAGHTAGGTVTVSGAAFSSTASSGTGQYTQGANTTINVTQTANPNYVNDTYTIGLNAAGTAITSVKDSSGIERLTSAPTGVTLVNGANALNLSNGVTLSANYSGPPAQANSAGGTFTVTGAHAGGSYHYGGNTTDRSVAITSTQTVLTNVRGDSKAFTEAFSSMKALKDALNTNNVAAIKSSIDQLNTAGNDMSELTAEIGGRLKSVSLQEQTYNSMKTQTDQLLSQHESTDIPAAVTKLSQAQTALQAAYSVTSKINNVSLVNYLK